MTESLLELILDLATPGREVAPARLATLTDDAWSDLLRLAGQHRIQPLLHWRFRQELTALELPTSVAAQLDAGHRKSALRSLLTQRELILLAQTLDEQGIPFLILKGADLAFHAYPQAALRPMRDLDLLLPEQGLLPAFNQLLALGFSRIKAGQGDPSAWAEHNKHLPPLRSPRGVMVELHGHLLHTHVGEHDVVADIPGVWDRHETRLMGGREMRFLSGADLALHLVVHAVQGHYLNNGPLIVPDLIFLSRTGNVDWPLFWRLARDGGWDKGCQLVRDLLVQQGCPVIPPPPSGMTLAATPAPLLQTCARLMLDDCTRIQEARLAGELAKRKGLAKFRVIWERVFPARQRLRTLQPLVETPLGLMQGYGQHWRRLVMERLPLLMTSSLRRDVRQTGSHIHTLEEWLRP